MLRAFVAIVALGIITSSAIDKAEAKPLMQHHRHHRHHHHHYKRHVAEPQIVIRCGRFGCTDRRVVARATDQIKITRHGHYTTRLAGRPRGCPNPWCGCWYSLHKFGRIIPRLNLAANWRFMGVPAGGPGPGVTVVWPHHVGEVIGRGERGWIVLSGNDGHAVRQRERSLRGAIAFRRLNGQFASN